jgi:4-hydroxybenzoyl-CoA thioesterase
MSISVTVDPVSTPRVNIYPVHVEFGDCDPARIVWFPNFFRWCDAASRHFFTACGIPLWHETEKTRGIIGTPLVDIHARFVMTASNDDVLQIHTSIIEWRQKSFVQRHRVLRPNAAGEPTLIMECDEIRIFAARREGSTTAIRALPIPADIRALCE